MSLQGFRVLAVPYWRKSRKLNQVRNREVFYFQYSFFYDILHTMMKALQGFHHRMRIKLKF